MSPIKILLTGSALAFGHGAAAFAIPAISGVDVKLIDGDAPALQITGLEPNSNIRITTVRAASWTQEQFYQSEAVFRADQHGRVDPQTQAPVEGRWTEADAFGLLWSAQLMDADEPLSTPASTVLIYADVDMDGQADLGGYLDLRGGLEGYTEVAVGPQLPGAFFWRPEGPGPFPVVITLGGSEGEDTGSRMLGEDLIARGYAVLGIPYYSPSWYEGMPQQFPDLPAAFENIALDKAEIARDWLLNRSDVRHDAIGIYGVSKGAEFALAAASRIDGFAAVAAIVPSDVIWEGWGLGTTPGEVSSFSWRGEPLDFVPYEGMQEVMAAIGRGERRSIRPPHENGRAANPDRVRSARIAVENIDEPVFLLGGEQDDLWPSGQMATYIDRIRNYNDLTTTALIYPDAGHGLSGPPTSPSSAADAAAKAEAFPLLLEFFEQNLR